MFWSLFIFCGPSTWEPASTVMISRVTFYFAGPHRNWCSLQQTQEKLRRGFGKNAGEWTGKVKIMKEEIPGSKLSIHSHILTYSRL